MLGPDEFIYQSWFANHTQCHWRAVGGRLFLTESRLLFYPNSIDARLGGQLCDIALDQITAIREEPSNLSLRELFSGGLRTRLRIEAIGGRVELFVVQHLADVIRSLSAQVFNHVA